MLKINLVNYRSLIINYNKYRLILLLMIFSLVGIVLNFFIYLNYQLKINQLEVANNVLNQEIIKLDSKITKVIIYKKSVNQLNSVINQIQQIKNSSIQLTEFLELINKITPSEIYYNNINLEDHQAKIIGNAKSALYLSVLIDNLNSSSQIEKVMLNKQSIFNQELISFELELKFKNDK